MNKETTRSIRKDEVEKDGLIYSYELIERKGRCMADFGMRLYSIRVSMTDENGQTRKGEARDIFSSKFKAVLFYEKIVRNLATPIDLKYVVEDEITV
jgi:hypothetical protein